MFSPESVLCFSTIDWDFIWQGHQEVMSTLAQQGHRVLFVENTGVRSPRLRDFARIRHRYRKWNKSTHGFWQVEENLHVYSPLILPFPYAGWARWINRIRMSTALRRWMLAADFRSPICWTFLPTPLTLDVIHRIPHKLLVYYCIDSFADSTPAAERIVPSEEQLFREADLVFVTSQALFERASRFNRCVHLFPFGVRFETFRRSAQETNGLPQELQSIPSPRIGYVGGIHRWIDQDLLIETARCHRSYAFVLVGPEQIDARRLTQEPNIFLLGQKPHEELPRYIRHFDVGIIPYQLTPYTNNVYPTKLNEYHALGIPVVSTPLPEVEAFNQRNGPLVRTGRTAGEFSRALQEALTHNTEREKNERVQSAQANAWSQKIDQMQRLIRQTASQKEAAKSHLWAARLREAFGIRPRWVTRLALGAALLTGVIFQTPMIWWLAKPLQIPQQIQPADAIVVFGGGVGESGRADESYQERVQQAVHLYRQGVAPAVVLISGDTWTFNEVDVMRALSKDLGVPPGNILTEQRVSRTTDYVKRVGDLAHAKAWRSILLVTSPYHARRAHLVFKKQAPQLQVFHASSLASGFYAPIGRGVTGRQLQGLLKEALGILWYRWNGWI